MTEPSPVNPIPLQGRESFDEALIDAADRLLTAALRGRAFKLAVQCTRCGTWLVAPASVKRHLGPVCAAKIRDAA